MPATTIDPIAQHLNALAQESPELRDAARVYAVILPLLRDADLGVGPVEMTEAQAHAKLEQGLPLLHEIDLVLDVQAVHDLMIRLALALEVPPAAISPQKHRPLWARSKTPDIAALYETAQSGDSAALRAAAVRQIRSALEENRLDLNAFLLQLAAGDSGYATTLALELKLDAGLLWTLAQNTMKPALRAWQRQLLRSPKATRGKEVTVSSAARPQRWANCKATIRKNTCAAVSAARTGNFRASSVYSAETKTTRRLATCMQKDSATGCASTSATIATAT